MKEQHGTNNAMLSAEEAEVRDLIREAGPRPAVPAEDLRAIKSAARAEWLELVRSESKRETATRSTAIPRWLPLAAGLALLFVTAWWWVSRDGLDGVAPIQVATVEVGDSSDLGTGDALLAGTAIETQLEAVSLRLSGGQALRLAAGTEIQLVSVERVELERGTLYFDSRVAKQVPSSAVEISTPHGTVRHVGTQFEVRLNGDGPALRVRVREGKVILERGGGESHLASMGEELAVSSAGAVSRATVDVYGESWAWVQRSAPAMRIEGRSLADYLAWISRETGWSADFSDPDLAFAAETIELHGSIEGLTPVESLEVVLAGSGLEHRVEAGALLVTRP